MEHQGRENRAASPRQQSVECSPTHVEEECRDEKAVAEMKQGENQAGDQNRQCRSVTLFLGMLHVAAKASFFAKAGDDCAHKQA